MKDNVKYTAMRMFQNISGADTLYINTYALNAPRLSVFKNVPLCKESDEREAPASIRKINLTDFASSKQ
jgi:hypothetical protein